MPATKQQTRQIIANNNLTSAADVYSLLRDSLKDILPELIEAESDAYLAAIIIEKYSRSGNSPEYLAVTLFLCILL